MSSSDLNKIIMGIVSYCAKCLNCGAKYRLRYNVGNKYPQSATFPCDECGEDLTVGVTGSEQDYLTQGIERIEDDMSLKVVNLHPEITIDPALINDPYYFPSLDSLMKQNAKGINGLIRFQEAQLSCIQYQKHWDEIAKDFRYLKEKRWKLLEEKYGADHSLVEEEVIGRVIFAMDFFLVGTWRKIFPGIGTEIEKSIKHQRFPELKLFLSEFKDDVFFNKMFSIMTRYREVEAILLPTLLDQKCGFTPEGISSKIDWEKIKHFYGEVYEIYGDMLVVPSAMNNMIVRSDYQKFTTPGFTIDKYIDTDKAGRGTNFTSNPNLEPLSKFYVASIRNGTHHEASTFDKTTQQITLRTGKGGKVLKTLPLIDYIVNCNELYARLLILFRIYSTLLKGEI